MKARMKTMKKLRNALAISFDLPNSPVCIPGPCPARCTLRSMASSMVCCEVPGIMLALIVTWRLRLRRLICAGPVPSSNRTTSPNGTIAELVRRARRPSPLVEPVAELGDRTDVDLVLLALLVVVADLVAGHQQPQRVGDVGDRDAQVGGLGAIDLDAVLRLAHRPATNRRPPRRALCGDRP